MCVLKVNVITLPYIFQVLYILCFTRLRYQVSVYRTIGPLVFSSAEPKAHGELSKPVEQASLCGCVRPVHIFKHDYLHNQQAYSNQILSEASLGWGKCCIMFWARSDCNSGFHGKI